MSPYPRLDRRQHPRHAPLTATPPEAGNIQLPTVGPADDIVGWWPTTRRQALAFWLLAAVSLAAIVAMAVFIPGYIRRFNTLEIIRTVLTWGFV